MDFIYLSSRHCGRRTQNYTLQDIRSRGIFVDIRTHHSSINFVLMDTEEAAYYERLIRPEHNYDSYNTNHIINCYEIVLFGPGETNHLVDLHLGFRLDTLLDPNLYGIVLFAHLSSAVT